MGKREEMEKEKKIEKKELQWKKEKGAYSSGGNGR